MKFSKRRREVPLQSIWTIMVAAKLDQSGVPVNKFYQNRSTLKGRSAGQRHTDRQTQRQAGGFSRPDYVPSSERRQFRMPPSFDRSTTPRRQFNYNIPASVVLLHATIGGRLPEWQTSKCISSVSLFESSRNFCTIHMRHRRKK